MPPPPRFTGISRASNPTPSINGLSRLPKICLLALVVATSIRLAILFYMRRKRKIASECQFLQEKDSLSCRVPLNKDVPYALTGNRKEVHWSAFRPIYPWVSPPQALPGPYDPRLYPPPTIRRHSSVESPEGPRTESKTISYTRRVSTNGITSQQSTLHGTVTNSHQGWRRNQWVVSGG